MCSGTTAQIGMKQHRGLWRLAGRRDQHLLVYEFPPFHVFPWWECATKYLCAQGSPLSLPAALPCCKWPCGEEPGWWRPPSALGSDAGPRAGTVSLRAGAGLGHVDLSPSTSPDRGNCPVISTCLLLASVMSCKWAAGREMLVQVSRGRYFTYKLPV